jgi:hypothetical protein
MSIDFIRGADTKKSFGGGACLLTTHGSLTSTFSHKVKFGIEVMKKESEREEEYTLYTSGTKVEES